MMFADYILAGYMQSHMRKLMRFHSASSANSWRPPKPETDAPLLLYLHVPFCEQVCSFCSFNRIKFSPTIAREYFNCLRKEIRAYAELGYVFNSVYVGGGTPTIVPTELQSTLRLVKELWPIDRISTETNPTHLTPEVLGLLRDLGVDRLSVGAQSFNDDVLRAIGRYEGYGSGRQIQERLAVARGFFDTLNVDMIFNYPMQSEQMLLQDLKTVKSIGADQITFYPLMSPKTKERKRDRNQRKREQTFYGLIRQELTGDYYSSSAWCFSSRNGQRDRKEELIDEYIVEYDDYAGLGAGSFGYLQGTLYSNTFDIPLYIEQLKKGMLPIVARKEFSGIRQVRYYFLMKLFGGSLAFRNIRRKYGRLAILRMWRELLFFVLTGAIKVKKRELFLTDKGYFLWIVLMREFFTGINIFREQCLPENRPGDREIEV